MICPTCRTRIVPATARALINHEEAHERCHYYNHHPQERPKIEVVKRQQRRMWQDPRAVSDEEMDHLRKVLAKATRHASTGSIGLRIGMSGHWIGQVKRGDIKNSLRTTYEQVMSELGVVASAGRTDQAAR